MDKENALDLLKEEMENDDVKYSYENNKQFRHK